MATVAALTIIRLYWWPGGRVASHIYLVGKIYVSDNELRSIKGELSAAAKHSISLLFHCAIAWPPRPPWPPILSCVSNGRSHGAIIQLRLLPKSLGGGVRYSNITY